MNVDGDQGCFVLTLDGPQNHQARGDKDFISDC